MDLAVLISEAASQAYKKDCTEKTCDVDILFHGRYKYKISITPMSKHILIKYKTIEYKVARDDKATFEEVVSFISDIIDNDANTTLNEDIEYNGYWPDDDENYDINTITLKSQNADVFSRSFMRDKFDVIIKNSLKCMLCLN